MLLLIFLQDPKQGFLKIICRILFFSLHSPDLDPVSFSHISNQFLHRSKKCDPSLIQDQNTAAQLFHLCHIMTCQHDGFPSGSKASDFIVKGSSPFHIQPGCRFIQEQNMRISDQCQCEMQPSLLSGRQFHIQLFFIRPISSASSTDGSAFAFFHFSNK